LNLDCQVLELVVELFLHALTLVVSY